MKKTAIRNERLKIQMKPAQPDNNPKVVCLKAWGKNMVREDYDFTAIWDWPKEALNVAWLWELDRELGSGNSPFFPAWQKWASRESKAKPEPPREQRPMLRAYPLAQAAQCLDKQGWRTHEAHPDYQITGRFAPNVYTRIHALEIDWRKTEAQLVEAFRNWLRDGEHEFHPDIQMDSRHTKGKRDTAGLRSHLRDLAIYRISEGGRDWKGGMKILDSAGMMKGIKGGFISSSNWKHAQDRTKKKIRERIGWLCRLAKLDAVGGGKEGFWRDHFIRMNDLKPVEDSFEL
jgi:hypothetical protein